MRATSKLRSGLTLVELVVVLAILAAVATTAIVASEGIVDQSRRERSVRTLEGFEQATIGRADLVDVNQRPWIQGFVADMGRLPTAVHVGPRALAQLWLPPDEPERLFRLASPPGDPAVLVAAGWRGPYLRLPLGSDGLYDGWGEPLIALGADGEAAQPGAEVTGVASLGANRAPMGEGLYDQDLALHVESPTTPPRHLGIVPLRIRGVPLGTTAVARVYGSVGGRPGTLAQASVASGDLASAAESRERTELALQLPGIPIGPRVLRVYVTSEEPPADLDAPIAASRASRVLPITVVAGGIPEVLVEVE